MTSPTNKPTVWQRSTTRRFLRWLFSWRGLRAILFIVVSLITLIALFYAEENWRGKHAWESYKREWEARGEKFDLADFIPPPVPDDQNFAMTPLLKPLFDFKQIGLEMHWDDTNAVNRIEIVNTTFKGTCPPEQGGGNWAEGRPTSLKPWQDYYRSSKNFPRADSPQQPARDVLLALSKFDAELQEIAQASHRPYARFPIDHEDFNTVLPHLNVLRSLTRVFLLRACARLELGQTDEALSDLDTCFQLADSIKDEPFLISGLVRIAILNLTIQRVWEELADHRWTPAQLNALKKRLGEFDLLADWHHVVRGERAVWNDMLLNKSKDLERAVCGQQNNKGYWGRYLSVAPRGWIYQNVLSLNRTHQTELSVIDTEHERVNMAMLRSFEKYVPRSKWSFPYTWMAGLLEPPISLLTIKYALAQTAISESYIACGLERYRLAHGEYPEKLETLVPGFVDKLPHDVINGQPLKYRRTSDGKFVLYSVGWNEEDDGGVVAMTKGKTPHQIIEQGDWVWRYP